jgi:hypothetical protein
MRSSADFHLLLFNQSLPEVDESVYYDSGYNINKHFNPLLS